MKLTTEQEWSKGYENLRFSRHNNSHSIVRFLENNVQKVKQGTCLEMGSYPGPFLAALGNMGFCLNGVDYNDDNDKGLVNWLQTNGYCTGQFWVSDIFQFNPGCYFDLVCSFGLIEHFSDYEKVILQHALYVKPNGQLILTTPNFRGWMQFLPHWLFDRENLSKHYLPSMYPHKWKEILESNGFEVTYSGYFGGYAFWYDTSIKRNPFSKLALKITEKIISQLNKIFTKAGFNSPAFSAYCGIVATKKAVTQ